MASNLHGIYLGCERIFTHIAETIDGDVPHGEDWHTLLLRQMRNEIPGIRPAVISTETGEVLDDLRRFRHVVRNVYTHRLDPVRLEKLVNDTSGMFTQLGMELSAFITFLERA